MAAFAGGFVAAAGEAAGDDGVVVGKVEGEAAGDCALLRAAEKMRQAKTGAQNIEEAISAEGENLFQ